MSVRDEILEPLLRGAEAARAAADRLSLDRPWPGLAREALASLSDDELVAGYATGHVPGVEPLNLYVAGDPDEGSLWLGHFDRPRFDECFAQGRITAHVHRWPFATRILLGGYTQWTYENRGTEERPDLQLARRSLHAPGSVYAIEHDVYHCVLAPKPDTLTLVLRGSRLRGSARPSARLSDDEAALVLERRDRVLALLAR